MWGVMREEPCDVKVLDGWGEVQLMEGIVC